MSGSQCGTYSISPKQMTVQYPSNCNGASITSAGDYEVPLDQPTEMTYLIYRCKGSAVFREIVDAAWDCGCAGVEELPFELVLDFDARLNRLVSEVDHKYEKLIRRFPSYFEPQSQSQSQEQVQGSGGVQPNHKVVLLARQRAMAHFGVHTRFSRLHRPYLIRGAQDPRFAYSRMVCLRSARKVIEIGRSMMDSSKRVDSIKIWPVNHHVFVSLTILVMDYCFNREEPRARERKEEILECFRLLEDGELSRESTIATRGLRKLRDILRDGAKARKSPEREPKNPSPPRAFQTSSEFTTYPTPAPAANTLASSGTNVFPAGNSFAQNQFAPVSQHQWEEMDYSSLDNLDFDVDLDASQFDILFQKFEGNKLL